MWRQSLWAQDMEERAKGPRAEEGQKQHLKHTYTMADLGMTHLS